MLIIAGYLLKFTTAFLRFDQSHMYTSYVQHDADVSVLDSELCDLVNMQMLREYSSSGGHIVLITDGKETPRSRRPLVEDVLGLLEEEGITADAILFTTEVDATGGAFA